MEVGEWRNDGGKRKEWRTEEDEDEGWRVEESGVPRQPRAGNLRARLMFFGWGPKEGPTSIGWRLKGLRLTRA